jgi:20S proteasome alpha/beta subunit
MLSRDDIKSMKDHLPTYEHKPYLKMRQVLDHAEALHVAVEALDNAIDNGRDNGVGWVIQVLMLERAKIRELVGPVEPTDDQP